MSGSRRGITLALVAASALVAACASGPREMRYERERSEAMRDRWMEHALLAPRDLRPDEALPLVVFLHDAGEGPGVLEREGVARAIERGWDEGSLPRFVLLAPDGDSGFWVNWYDGTRRYEGWVLDELIPRVTRRPGVGACPERCHLVGVGMGGDGALLWALHRRDAWASVTIVSASILDTRGRVELLEDRLSNVLVPTWHVFGPPRPLARLRAEDPWLVVSRGEALGARWTLAWSASDPESVRAANTRFHEHLEALEVAHDAIELDGERGWPAWRRALVQLIPRALAGEP